MKIPCTSTLMVAIMVALSSVAYAGNRSWTAEEEAQIQERIETMDLLVSPVYNNQVRDMIRRYVTYGYRDAEQMLSRSDRFFPIFEHYLMVNDMPESLKFLPIVESSLKPNAQSPVGASGLWQLMSGTAKELGLHISTYVDERLDPHLSTQAALAYLNELHERFGSWELAIAAYNCGPGNVRKAIRLGGSDNYWKIEKYLPTETRNYIPRFIAASYIAQYYEAHDLEPDALSYDMQFTRSTRVFSGVSFKKLANITGTSIATLKDLNPSYLRSYIPASTEGYLLVLPEMAMRALQDYERWSNSEGIKTDLPVAQNLMQADGSTPMVPISVVIRPGQTLSSIAADYEVAESEIRNWNELSETAEVYFQQAIILYLDKRPGSRA